MKIQLQKVLPEEIEKRSFEIITEEIGERPIDSVNAPVIKRVIHTSADFDYLDTLTFSDGAVMKGIQALKNGACIVTDTNMAKAGINKKTLASYGGESILFMADEDVAAEAKANGTNAAVACINKAAKLVGP
jgi:precorrin-8X/cobalt-precorrin-8 methylmutase